MTDPMTLREQVAQGLALEDGRIWDRIHFAKKERYRSRADAALSLIAEACATVAEDTAQKAESGELSMNWKNPAQYIAQRIRQMGKPCP